MTTQFLLITIAQVLLGGAFLVAGLRNLKSFAGLEGALTHKRMPMPKLALAIALVLQIGGGALVALGVWDAIGAIALIVFVVLATLLFHNFWAYEGEERVPHLNAFITNTALAGGFLLVLALAL